MFKKHFENFGRVSPANSELLMGSFELLMGSYELLMDSYELLMGSCELLKGSCELLSSRTTINPVPDVGFT